MLAEHCGQKWTASLQSVIMHGIKQHLRIYTQDFGTPTRDRLRQANRQRRRLRSQPHSLRLIGPASCTFGRSGSGDTWMSGSGLLLNYDVTEILTEILVGRPPVVILGNRNRDWLGDLKILIRKWLAHLAVRQLGINYLRSLLRGWILALRNRGNRGGFIVERIMILHCLYKNNNK